MKKRFALISLLLVLALTAGLFSGCGAKAASGASTSTGTASGEPATVVMYLITFNNIPDDYSRINDAVNARIAEAYPDANVKLDLRLFSPADYDNKIKLALQSGTQMDLFIPLDLQGYIAQNMCMDITSQLDTYGSGIQDALAQDFGDGAFDVLKGADGGIYGVPINKAVVITPTLSYNKEMLAATGYSIDDINSVRDLTDVFAKVKELYPDVYCFAPTNMQDSYVSLLWAGEKKVDRLGDTNYATVAIGDDSTVVNFFNTPEFKEYCELMREWYLAGYVPQDMATSTTTASEYAAAGRLFCSWASYSGIHSESDDSVFNLLVGTDAFASKWLAPAYMDTKTSSLAMCVSSGSKDPDAAMKLLNILYTDETVINTILYGIEGTDYVKVSDHVVRFPDGLDANTVPYTAYLCNGVLGTERLQWVMTDEQGYEDKNAALEMNKTAERSPFYGFSFDAAKVVNELTAISNVVNQYYPGLVCGSVDPDEAIPQFVKALEDAGINTVIAEKQTQLDAWIAANK